MAGSPSQHKHSGPTPAVATSQASAEASTRAPSQPKHTGATPAGPTPAVAPFEPERPTGKRVKPERPKPERAMRERFKRGRRTATPEPAVAETVPTEAAHTQTLVALHDADTAVRRPSLADTAVHPARAVGGLLPEQSPAPETSRRGVLSALTDPAWLLYLAILLGGLVATLILGIKLVLN